MQQHCYLLFYSVSRLFSVEASKVPEGKSLLLFPSMRQFKRIFENNIIIYSRRVISSDKSALPKLMLQFEDVR